MLDFKNRRPLERHREIRPRPELLRAVLGAAAHIGTLLTLEDLSLSFGGVRAIDGVDLEIRTGEVHGLIGPNGSGKTTTLNVISGYYAPQQGRSASKRQDPAVSARRTRAPASASRAPSRRHGWSAPLQSWKTS